MIHDEIPVRMETRPATAEDAEGIRRVARAAWDAAYDFLPPKEHDAAFKEWYSPERLAAETDADDVEFFVATADDDLIGFAHATATTDPDSVGEGELQSIYVAPDHWRNGAGTALLSDIEDRLDDRGFTRLKAPVFAENERGKRFLEANGFERIEDRVIDLFTGGTRQQYLYYHQFPE